MTRRETVLEFLSAFCAGRFDRLRPLLTEDLHVTGPFLHTDSREDYLRRLGESPAEPSDFRAQKVFEDEDEVCVFYEIAKPVGPLVIAQRNRFDGDRIARIELVFDGRAFT